MEFLELPDSLIPRRGADSPQRDLADIAAVAVASVPEADLAGEIDRLDKLMFGAPLTDIARANLALLTVELIPDDALPSFLALSLRRMLLRSRQLGLKHDRANAGTHVRAVAQLWANAFAENERQLHGDGR
jgi:hypothetical protein